MDFRLYFAKMISKMQRPSLRNCVIDRSSRVYEKSELQNVVIGRHSYVGKCSIISDVVIGNFCSVAGYGQIGGGMHPTDMVSASPCFLAGHSSTGRNFAQIEFHSSATIEIGNDVWIGAGCYIKAGIKIGTGAIIGAHSVVTHDVEPYAIVAGVPAKVIRKRFDDKTIERLLALKWWNWPEDKLQKYGQYFSAPEKLFEVIEKD